MVLKALPSFHGQTAKTAKDLDGVKENLYCHMRCLKTPELNICIPPKERTEGLSGI